MGEARRRRKTREEMQAAAREWFASAERARLIGIVSPAEPGSFGARSNLYLAHELFVDCSRVRVVWVALVYNLLLGDAPYTIWERGSRRQEIDAFESQIRSDLDQVRLSYRTRVGRSVRLGPLGASDEKIASFLTHGAPGPAVVRGVTNHHDLREVIQRWNAPKMLDHGVGVVYPTPALAVHLPHHALSIPLVIGTDDEELLPMLPIPAVGLEWHRIEGSSWESSYDSTTSTVRFR